MRTLLIILAALFCAACQPANNNVVALQATLPPTQPGIAVATAIPTTAVPPSATPTLTPTPTATATATITLTPSPTLTPSLTFTPSATLTPTLTPTLARMDFYAFQRPFTRAQNDYADRTYPYGMGGIRGLPIHHGSDFQNGRFTPILAVGGGTVYYAGDDLTQLFGPMPNYYGRLVVIAHDVKTLDGEPVYTLYGHMQEIVVETGERVSAGQRIGTVGDAGVAFGPHLHLEVRVGDPESFGSSRNPELWMSPYPGFGTLAGHVSNPDGTVPYEMAITVRRAGLTGGVGKFAYTYADDPLINSDTVWQENFVLADLEADTYDVIVSENSGRVRFRDTITITAGRTTWIEIVLRP